MSATKRLYKIALCDDDAADAVYAGDLVRRWAEAQGYALHLEQFPSAEAFLFDYEDHKDWDILLLDVEMGKMDGVSLAKQLRRDNETLQIVFTTGYTDYLSDGYEVSALHYLLKPLDEEKLSNVLDRAVGRLRKNEQLLTLRMAGETLRLPVYRIRYADVQRNYLTIHAGENLVVKMTLSELADQLDERFYRVGRSALVNLGCIRRVNRTEIQLEDGSLIPLPRGAYDGVCRAIMQRG